MSLFLIFTINYSKLFNIKFQLAIITTKQSFHHEKPLVEPTVTINPLINSGIYNSFNMCTV